MSISAINPSPFMILVALAAVVIAMRWLFRPDNEGGEGTWATLRHELAALKRVWSVQTIANTEAGFIRDRLPTRWPFRRVSVACVLHAGMLWLATR